MRQELLEKIAEYRAYLESDPRIKKLEELEEAVNDNSEIKALSNSLQKAEYDFEEKKTHFGGSSEEAKAAQKALYGAKLKLDSHPLVKEYNAAYIVVKDLYLYIDDILFSSFRVRHTCSEGDKHA